VTRAPRHSPADLRPGVRRRGQLALAGAVVLSAACARTVAVPARSGRVVDTAHVLSQPGAARIEALSAELERATTAQVAILIVPSLRGEPIERYALRVFEAWKLGQKGKENGVLVVVVPRDRTMRIQVGVGLGDVLDQEFCRKVLDEVLAPSLREGDFDGGLAGGVRAIGQRILHPPPAGAGEEPPPGGSGEGARRDRGGVE
jgi:uncharacterized protein